MWHAPQGDVTTVTWHQLAYLSSYEVSLSFTRFEEVEVLLDSQEVHFIF